MHKKSIVNYKTLSILFYILLITTARARLLYADDLSHYSTSDVLSKVMETYSRVYSASGRITRTFEANEIHQTIKGRFAVVRPGRLYVEYIGEDRQITVNDGETLRVYYPDQNRGLYQHTREMNPLESFLLGPEPFFGNILQLMGDNFKIELADMVSGNLILKAQPVTPLQFNFILVSIDPKTWTIQAIEQFDTHNKLVSQTRYLEFKSAGDSLYFPTKTKTSTVSGDNLLTETLELSRVQINIDFDDERFKNPGNSDTEWIVMNNKEQNPKPE